MLIKQEVFGLIIQMPKNVKLIGYKWVFIWKCNYKNEIIRYKTQLVTQGFLCKPGIDYEEIYSLVMNIITFQFLISLMILKGWDMCLMNVFTTFLYGFINNDIYMKIFKVYYISW